MGARFFILVSLAAISFLSGCTKKDAPADPFQSVVAPTANDQTVITNEDTPVTISLTGKDPNGQPLTYTLASRPLAGSVTGTPPNVLYTPPPNFYGTANFSFKVSNGVAASSAAKVSITIRSVNDSPTAAPQSVTTNEFTAKGITLSGSDPEGSALQYTVIGTPANGTLSGTAPNLIYQPTAFFNGGDSFAYFVSDGSISSQLSVVSITVNSVVYPPKEIFARAAVDERVVAKAVDKGRKQMLFLVKTPQWQIKSFTEADFQKTTITPSLIISLATALEDESFKGFVVQPDGKFVISGNVGPSSTIVRRFNRDGTLDTAFGQSGTLTFNDTSGALAPFLLALDSGSFLSLVSNGGDSRIVAISSTGTVIRDWFGFKPTMVDGGYVYLRQGSYDLCRMSTSTLVLDATFGTAGCLTLPNDLQVAGWEHVGIQSGNLYVVDRHQGINSGNIYYSFQWRRFNFQGVEDAAFAAGHAPRVNADPEFGQGDNLCTAKGYLINLSSSGMTYSNMGTGPFYAWPYSPATDGGHLNELWDGSIVRTDSMGAHWVR